MTLARRFGATAVGLLASRVVPTVPDELHPVARFGRTMHTVERVLWRDDRDAGAIYAAAGVLLGSFAGRATGSTAAMVTVCAAGGQLRSVATDIGDRLEAGDLDGARVELPALVGRDPSELDESGIAAAVIESVAENMVDAVFAPAFWAVLGGAAAVGAHRALNTMDAMVGRRDERYGQFGWASARADDGANYLPARLFAATLAAARPDRAAEVLAAVRADAPQHPSPNAGVAEAAMAGALGCELGGPLRYGAVHEDRPRLGSGPRPGVAELRQALALAERAETVLAGGCAVASLILSWGRRR